MSPELAARQRAHNLYLNSPPSDADEVRLETYLITQDRLEADKAAAEFCLQQHHSHPR